MITKAQLTDAGVIINDELLARLLLHVQHLLCMQVSQKSVKEEVQHGEELINLLKGFTEQLETAKEVQDKQKCAPFIFG